MDEYDAANIPWKSEVMAQEVEDALGGEDEHTCYIQHYNQSHGLFGIIIDGTQEVLGGESECEIFLQGFLKAMEIIKENQ